MATVWRAEDPLLGRPVALKLLDARLASQLKARRRFLHEAQAVAALEHPGIIGIHDCGEADGQVYIALALIEGETLSERASRRLLPFTEAVHIVASAADALQHAHERHVVHRDVTGRNIMIARDGRVVVLDFGLALADWESRVTTTEVANGTAPYLAPEVIQGRRADTRSDLYGLGIALYEALTGAYPFHGEHLQAMLFAVANLDPVPPRARRPDMPLALDSAVLRAIARDPDARYQTAAEFAAALRGLDLTPQRPDHGSSVGAGHAVAPARADATSAAARAEDTPVFLAVGRFEVAESYPEPVGAAPLLASRLADRLRHVLGRAPGLRLVPAQEGAASSDARTLATESGANLLLRGSVSQAGSRMRVTYHLLDPWRGTEEGGETLDGSALQVFELEDEVAKSIARALGLASATAMSRPKPPEDPAAEDHYRQALAYLRRYDNEASINGALTLFERLVACEGHRARNHAGYARACLYKSRVAEERVWEGRAARACEIAQRLDPEAPEVALALGQLALHTGQHEVALGHFERARRAWPDSFDALLGIARAHHDAARYDEAKRECTSAIAAAPDDWRGHSLLGSIHFRAGRSAEALAPWQRVIELTPDNSRGHCNLGNAYYGLDRWADAVAAYERSLAIQPNREAYTNLGTTLYYMGREEASLEAFRHAAELMPTDPVTWGNLGDACHWIRGHEAEGEAALDRAIAVMRERLVRNPADARQWVRLASWLANRGRLEEAREAVESALRLAPADVRCQVQAAQVLLQLGERARCLGLLAAAREGGYGAKELLRSRTFAVLHDDPAFSRLVGAVTKGGPSEVEGRPSD